MAGLGRLLALGIAAPFLIGAGGDAPIAEIVRPTDDFSRAERYEANPGGAGTIRNQVDRNAFSQPAANLSFEDRATFNIGNAMFRRPWVSAPSSTTRSDGLGPLFNARACQQCHLKDGRGHPPEANFPDDTAQSMLMRLSVPARSDEERQLLASGRINALPEPVYGGQLQDLAIQGHAIEGRIHTEWTEHTVEMTGGETASLRTPAYSIVDLGYGDIDPDTMMSVRIAPPMIGLGLIEAIPEDSLLAHADPDDLDGDGISGAANRVWSPTENALALGRFGWKANVATLNEQNTGAFHGDIGLSSTLSPDAWGDCTPNQPACRDAVHGIGEDEPVEISDDLIDALLFYTQSLGVPARRDVDDPQVLAGKALFDAAGCVSCHVPKFVTADDADHPAFARQLIWPYADFLLHDMGPGLADNRPDGQADGQEWRTPPLWGIGLTEAVSGHSYYLHDGRARSLTEAILWHGGEGQAARDRFAGFEPAERAALLRFLGSL